MSENPIDNFTILMVFPLYFCSKDVSKLLENLDKRRTYYVLFTTKVSRDELICCGNCSLFNAYRISSFYPNCCDFIFCCEFMRILLDLAHAFHIRMLRNCIRFSFDNCQIKYKNKRFRMLAKTLRHLIFSSLN